MLARDRTKRVIKPPTRLGYADLILFSFISVSEVLDEEPRYYNDVMRSKDRKNWLKSIDYEIKSIYDNNTWNLIKRSARA